MISNSDPALFTAVRKQRVRSMRRARSRRAQIDLFIHDRVLDTYVAEMDPTPDIRFASRCMPSLAGRVA